MVERREVVVVELHLRPLDDAIAEADEHVLYLPLGADEKVPRPNRGGGGARQGDVDPVRGDGRFELRGVEL
jgi:hypothetical protein